MHLQDVILLVLLQIVENKRTFKHIEANKTYQEAFCQLGQSWDISAELFQKLPEITCGIYVPSTDATKSVRPGVSKFVLDEERSIPVNFHLVKGMSFVLTTSLQFRGAVCSAKSKGNWMYHR